MTKDQIGKIVAKSRKAQGLTVYRMTKDAGVQRNQVKAIECGDKAYTIDSLLATAKHLGLRVQITAE